MTAFEKAWKIIKSNTYDEDGNPAPLGYFDWQGEQFDNHCPKCRKGFYFEEQDELYMISNAGMCSDCLMSS